MQSNSPAPAETSGAAAVSAHVRAATSELAAAAALVPHCGQEEGEEALADVVAALSQSEAAAQVGLFHTLTRLRSHSTRGGCVDKRAPMPPFLPACLQAVHCALRCLQQKQAGGGMRPLASLQVSVAGRLCGGSRCCDALDDTNTTTVACCRRRSLCLAECPHSTRARRRSKGESRLMTACTVKLCTSSALASGVFLCALGFLAAGRWPRRRRGAR